MSRDNTIIYRSFYEAIMDLPKENQADLWQAIFEFALDFKEPELSGINKTVFTLIRPQLEANNKKYKTGVEHGHKGARHGKKGGRPKNEKPSNNPQETLTKPSNENVKEKENVNENDNVNETAQELKNSHQWIQDICMKKKVPEKRVRDLLDEFIDNRILEEDMHKGIKELKRHFINWLNIQLTKPPPPPEVPKPPLFVYTGDKRYNWER